MKSIVDHLKTELIANQARYSKNADSRRSPVRRYQPGDLVWLNAQELIRNYHRRYPDKPGPPSRLNGARP
ncbi:hypothetical protein OCU04_009675 [Sclerotinia nivalis]|uniref:Uncharacterized protein n=1 Tax=Sclerotinia nivalis TaxID=352851 RepID=A0A9X0AGE2_9HELO|nr:hypothetical protein OCU04_009675 [Sclerotinia nivalis]